MYNRWNSNGIWWVPSEYASNRSGDDERSYDDESDMCGDAEDEYDVGDGGDVNDVGGDVNVVEESLTNERYDSTDDER